VDVYSFLQNSNLYNNANQSQNEATVAEIVDKSGVLNSQGKGILSGVHAAKVCCVLSSKADELFHSAALRLALPGLYSFLTELCKSSHSQLFTRYDESPNKQKKWWKKELEAQQKPPTTLLLHRIGEVTLKCIRSGRPLIHTMKMWSIVGPHFMQAACHKDRTVSKKAVQCIHDTVTALLNEQTELPHFHFNEALFKPFENLLCLELCDPDVQDQIVSCLCEFVEANRTEICSGWRPLFGTLRVANSKHNAAAILEVFKIFLQTDNTLVFANAALDYILCLLSHIRNTNVDDNNEISQATNNNNGSKYPDKTQKDEKNAAIQDKKNDFVDKESEFANKVPNGPEAKEFDAEDESKIQENPYITLALKQLLIIMIECIAQPNENIARLGTSCVRHIILSVGQILTAHQWEILVTAMHRASTISLNPLHQLTLAFKQNSDSFYGDMATVKVAARKDSTVSENERLYELAQQVFLMQAQRNCNKCSGKMCECEQSIVIDDRSYVFLLYPLDMTSVLNPDLYTVRVPFRNLVVGILAHQMLIQTISSALLQNLNHVTPILNILQINSCSLRGILKHVNAKHVNILLKCLEISNIRAKEFDLRPGLKFLTQKVGNLNKAANLYTQANTSEVVQIIVLIELCLDGIEKYTITPSNLKELLGREEKDKCHTDLDYIEQFLRKLRNKWEYLCESYVSLTINIPDDDQISLPESKDENDSEEFTSKEPVKSQAEKWTNKPPFKLADFKRTDSFSSSTDSESYLEKDTLPNMANEEETIVNEKHAKTKSDKQKREIKNCKNKTDLNSTDDETNEMAAKFNNKNHTKYNTIPGSIKYDTNTLLQMKSTLSSDSIISKMDGIKAETRDNKETVEKIETMLEQYRQRKPIPLSVASVRSNPFSGNVLPPPQPIPPEIQQQRSISIFKDAEAYKITRIETMEACLELLGSLSSDRLAPLALVLKDGAVMLISAQDEKIKISAESLLQRMNISYVDDVFN
ncbi:hypothetical protein AMK59_4793, partial [Oryctes borbonicus]